jgi:hypothetical protein
MIIIIYPSECTLYQGDYVASQWVEYRYFDRPKVATRTEAGFIKVRDPLRPLGIKAHFAALSEDKRWAKLADGHHYDAEHVLCMARIGKKGMSIISIERQKEII